jgi:hypothetical protein
VVRQVPFEEMEAAVDVADQPGAADDQEHGADSAAGQVSNPVGQLLLDVAGGEHGTLPFRRGPILDSLEASPLALPQLVQDSRVHSKASVAWSIEDMYRSQLFQEHRGFSSLFSKFAQYGLHITLGSGLV